jgi:hypothetical protein
MVEAAVPIDPALDFVLFYRRRRNVRDLLAFIHDLHDRHVCNRTRIVRLASGGRIKCRAVEVDAPPIFSAAGHPGAKFL